MAKRSKPAGKPRPSSPDRSTMADRADRYDLYQRSVQNVEGEIDFVDETFRKLRKRKGVTLREDFCGAGATSCEWVKRRRTNEAIGQDIDPDPLAWGEANNIAALTPGQRSRVKLVKRDVTAPPKTKTDIILAMNFSYWCLMERARLLRYFKRVRSALNDDGVFFLDFYGGSDAVIETEEVRQLDGFKYVWDQVSYNPITGKMDCAIHFKFPDGSKMKNAFTYTWRQWHLPEIRDLLEQAGFARVTVYWEGDDGDGGGNGEFEPTGAGEACEAFICYITAEK